MGGRCAESHCSQLLSRGSHFSSLSYLVVPPALVHAESIFYSLITSLRNRPFFNQLYSFSSARSSFRISSTPIPKHKSRPFLLDSLTDPARRFHNSHR